MLRESLATNRRAASRGEPRGVDRAIGDVTAQLRLRRQRGRVVKKLNAEIKQTNKAVADLARKFERFDDRMTVQSKDQDQRL